MPSKSIQRSFLSDSAAKFVALFFVAFNLRIAMACLGPVVDSLRDELKMSYAQLGLLSTLPVLCMSLFAPLAQRVAAKHGTEWAILFATLLIALATLARAWANASAMLATAFFAGVGIAIVGTLLNSFVKQHFAQRALNASALYSAALCLGAAMAAGVTAPLTSWLHGDWRSALAIWSIPGFLGAALWWQMMRRLSNALPKVASTLPSLPWRESKAWLITLFFGLQSITFYVVLAWLAPMYVELGWSAAKAGALLGYWITLQVVFIAIVARVANRSLDRRPWLMACSAAAIIAMSGFAYAPTTATWLWIALLGLASGGWFPLCMTLPLDYSRTPSEAGSWTALMLLGGYLISAPAPWLAGRAHDLGASYAGIFGSMAILSAAILILTQWLTPRDETTVGR